MLSGIAHQTGGRIIAGGRNAKRRGRSGVNRTQGRARHMAAVKNEEVLAVGTEWEQSTQLHNSKPIKVENELRSKL